MKHRIVIAFIALFIVCVVCQHAPASMTGLENSFLSYLNIWEQYRVKNPSSQASFEAVLASKGLYPYYNMENAYEGGSGDGISGNKFSTSRMVEKKQWSSYTSDYNYYFMYFQFTTGEVMEFDLLGRSIRFVTEFNGSFFSSLKPSINLSYKRLASAEFTLGSTLDYAVINGFKVVGTLPKGLSVVNTGLNKGKITGTPGEAGTFPVKIVGCTESDGKGLSSPEFSTTLEVVDDRCGLNTLIRDQVTKNPIASVIVIFQDGNHTDIAQADADGRIGTFKTTGGTFTMKVTYGYYETQEYTGTAPATGTLSCIFELIPPIMKVTPNEDYLGNGTCGGTFSPASKTYQVKNVGKGTPLAWTISQIPYYVTAAPSEGTLAPGESVNVAVTIQAATFTAIETRSQPLIFVNQTSGYGDCQQLVKVKSYWRGDANGDQYVNARDAQGIVDILLGKRTAESSPGRPDSNGDGKLDSADLIKVLSAAKQKVTEAPRFLTATVGNPPGVVNLKWVPAPYATQYTIYRATSDQFSAAAKIGTISHEANAWTDKTAKSGEYYHYWVKAANGQGTGPQSASAYGYSGYPPRPVNLKASFGAYKDYVKLEWDPVLGAMSYDILRGTTADVASAKVVGNASYWSWEDRSAPNFKTQYYWIKARNAAGASGPGPSAQGYRGVPPAPTGVQASDAKSMDSITITWNSALSATQYAVYRSASDDPVSAVKIQTTTELSCNNSYQQLEEGKKYYYWVKAENPAGPSDFSAPDTGSLMIDTEPWKSAIVNAHVSWSLVPGGILNGEIFFPGARKMRLHFSSFRYLGTDNFERVIVTSNDSSQGEVFTGSLGSFDTNEHRTDRMIVRVNGYQYSWQAHSGYFTISRVDYKGTLANPYLFSGALWKYGQLLQPALTGFAGQ